MERKLSWPACARGRGPRRLGPGATARPRGRGGDGGRSGGARAVSQICSFMCLLSMVTMRAPNSTPMVRSCTGWKRLSVNCSSRQDLPTPARGPGGTGSVSQGRASSRQQRRARAQRRGCLLASLEPQPGTREDAPWERGWQERSLPVSPMMMYLNKYLPETRLTL